MKILSPKKSSRIYAAFTLLSISIMAFFLCSNMIFSSESVSSSVNYDTQLTQNCYTIKITDASFHDGIIEFTLKCKLTQTASTQSYPEVSSVTFDSSLVEYEFETGEKYDDYSQIVTVLSPPNEFELMKITVTSKLADTVYEDSYNDFGELVEGYTQEGESFSEVVTVDKKDMSDKHIEAVPGYSDSVEENGNDTFDDPNLSNEEASIVASESETTSSKATEKPAETSESSTQSSAMSSAETTVETTLVTQQTQSDEIQTTQPQTVTQTTTSQIQTTTDVPQTTAASATKASTTTAKSKTTTTKKTTTATTKSTSSVPTKISISNGDVTIGIGQSITLSAFIEPSNAETSITWSVNRNDLASVNSKGEVSALAAGKVIVTATTSNGLSASTMITIE
ncbi:MAG: Ig-like domain-containing protein [Ruminococcus sp.]|nr:Ig-like domain-containing protein [Ruminococcus sp.]